MSLTRNDELKNYDKRMRLNCICRSFTINTCDNDIWEMFSYVDASGNKSCDYDVLNDIIFKVLMHIFYRTLEDDLDCTKGDIIDFIDEEIKMLSSTFNNINAERLADYIIVKVLQNEGRPFVYKIFDNETKTYKDLYIRLIRESERKYYLEDDAFDYIYRTLEIESNLKGGYQVEIYKLKLSMSYKNYSTAYNQSRHLLFLLGQMENRMGAFVLHCRENISMVEKEDYERVVSDFKNLMADENKEVNSIYKSAQEEIEQVRNAEEMGLDANELKDNEESLKKLVDNLKKVISKQRSLINKKSFITNTYEEILYESFKIPLIDYMDFEKDIMEKLRKMDDGLNNVVDNLFVMLKTPCAPHMMNIEQLYTSYNIVENKDDEVGIDISLKDDNSHEIIEHYNHMYSEFIYKFLLFASANRRFFVSDFLDSLPVETRSEWSKYGIIRDIIRVLYTEHIVYIDKVLSDISFEPEGEFDLIWCFKKVPKSLIDFNKLYISKKDENLSYVVNDEDGDTFYEMSDFVVEVE